MQSNQDHNSQSLGLVVTAAILAAVSIYFCIFAGSPKTALVLAAFSILSFAVGLLDAPKTSPVEIDELGIYDPRLGISKIMWKEVRDFYVEETQGHRFLCLSVNKPERFLVHADRSMKQQLALQHSLGFRRINVDLKHINLSIQALHERIEHRIQRAANL
jgi:hypothetical protein